MGEPVVRIHRARAAVRLVGEVCECGRATEPARRRLVDGLLALLGGAISVCVHNVRFAPGLKGGIVEATLAGFDGETIEVFDALRTQGSDYSPFHDATMRRLGGGVDDILSRTHEEIVARDDWERSEWINEYARPARLDWGVGSLRRTGRTTIFGLGAMRARGDRPFTDEDRELIHLVHLGVGRVFEAPSPRAQLAPRVQETLDVLLAGATDKEIAAALGISPYTVHQYVKVIFRAYGVSSRAQLIARAKAGSAR